MLKIINNRNTILIIALIAGLINGHLSAIIKPYTLYILAIVMIFSTTSFQFSQLKNYKFFTKTTLVSFLLNYVLFGIFLLVPAYFLIKEKELFYGFVVIAATPPGIAIIPFTFIFKGDNDYALIGVLGVYLLAIFISPLIIELFVHNVAINPMDLFLVTIKVIVIPLILSRLLLFKKIKPTVEKIRGKIVNWGFALIIYTVVGINRVAIFSDWIILIKSSIILIVAMFFLGFVGDLILKNRTNHKRRISMNLMLTIKSSGYTAATALVLFGDRSALPAAFLAIFVLIYLIIAGFWFDKKFIKS